jgi:phosphoribosyl 1,2-cyclic phosphodiesterase
MKVTILASGSKGNCIAIQSGSTCILIDAGVAKTKIEKALLEHGISPTDISGIFVTHAHGDHIKGLPLANKYRIPVFASEGEWKSIEGVDEELQYVANAGFHTAEKSGSDWLDITPFSIHHDAYQPLGYSVLDPNYKACVCLDTGKVDSDMLESMADSDIYIIESNHEPSMVEASNYPLSVQARILSDLGHLSNHQTAAALKRLIKGRGERIYLTHLSSSNNTPQIAENTVKLALFEKGFVKGKHYQLEVV